ncbi:MAG TPA: hypothetical protein VKZ43_03065 [Trueperaceae bacterium]|nr:hypothetical protein [Trueperaceae bacterium]
MRKLLVSLIAVAALGTGATFAQGSYWAGVSAGYPGAALHFGIDNVAPGFAVRLNAGYNYIGTGGFALGVDALYDLPVDLGDTPVTVYAGGGVGLGIGAGVALGVNLFVGGEFSLAQAGLPEGGVFLEVGPAIAVIPNFGFGVAGRLGFNYHF